MSIKAIITCGYMGSGSSAVTDLMAEYEQCINDHADFEFVFLHCPNGVFDLEDKLLIGNNAVRSDEAIRSFRHTMKQLFDKKYWWVGHYKAVVGSEFMTVTDRFIDRIIQYRFSGYWYYHENADAKMIFRLCLQKPLRIMFGKFYRFRKITKYNDQLYMIYIQPDDYYRAAREYIKDVFKLMAKDGDYVILDQLLLPFNLFRMDHYFHHNAYAIVVSRDPRDMYILNKYAWSKKDLSVPYPLDVNLFCKYYRDLRNMEKSADSKQILRIYFEDLIYQYDSTVARIEKHLNFTSTQHTHQFTRFNPERSFKNTQLFRDAKYEKEVSVIEKELYEYLYDFPYIVNNKVEDTIN